MVITKWPTMTKMFRPIHSPFKGWFATKMGDTAQLLQHEAVALSSTNIAATRDFAGSWPQTCHWGRWGRYFQTSPPSDGWNCAKTFISAAPGWFIHPILAPRHGCGPTAPPRRVAARRRCSWSRASGACGSATAPRYGIFHLGWTSRYTGLPKFHPYQYIAILWVKPPLPNARQM